MPYNANFKPIYAPAWVYTLKKATFIPYVLYTQGSCIVQQKGKEALGLNKDRQSKNDLNFGYTWLKTFKETYGWQRRMTHGEAGAADQVGIESAQRVLPRYDADDIYNADETAFM